MKTYRVRWEIILEAASAQEAERAARLIQLDPGSEATVFTVREDRSRPARPAGGRRPASRRPAAARRARTSTARR